MKEALTTDKFYFRCITCGREYAQHEAEYLCPKCEQKNTANRPPAGVLKTIYNYQQLKIKIRKLQQLQSTGFIDLLPLKSLHSMPFLHIGNTPLYTPEAGLFFKDDSQNPTFSFKDRASALVSAYAKEQGRNTIVTASTGNAGSSLAGICAAQRQHAVVLVPETAPVAKLTQIVMYGAKIIPVKGTYDDAFDLSIKASDTFGWYNRNTAYNPLTIEGKKTVSFELFTQLKGKIPDRIFVPVGDGVIISGVYKGYEDLLKLGFADRMPEIFAVQAKGSSNLINNLNTAKFEVMGSNTLADSISVDVPRNFFMARQFLHEYNGKAISVTDNEILEASSLLSRRFGLFSEPAAAAAYAGYLNQNHERKISGKITSVVLLTGSGLKDTAAVKPLVKIPGSITPNLENLKKLLS
jgi:threonine synthase